MLRNRLPEIEIPEEAPFQFDKLNRRVPANTFCSLVKMYSSTGCVIALNGEWGTGKTTFVKILMKILKKEGGHPLYFNAWENDYVSDPLIALLAELKELSPNSGKWDNVISSGGKILSGIATSAIKSFVKNKKGIDSNAIEVGIDEAEKILKDDIDSFTKQKTTFEEFRNNLQNYIAEYTTDNIPIVFFIDELDRCNPKFAVLVLERIKHLFDMPNIVFVLSMNKKQLGYAIQGYYGSANIDADNYLRRFIDIEYSLPRPNGEDFCQYLYSVYNFSEVFNHKERISHSEFRSDEDSFMKMAKILISSSKLDLRTTDKIFAHTRLALMEFSSNNYIVPDVFFLLCFLKIANTELYHNIIEQKFTAQQLLNEIEDFLPSELLVMDEYSSSWSQMTYAIASFVFMYTLSDSIKDREQIINAEDNNKCTLKTNHLDNKTFSEAVYWHYERKYQRGIPLHHLIQKIELEQGIQGI
jgi:energy-coupling factor transporter ATP-binding protein EcfA2